MQKYFDESVIKQLKSELPIEEYISQYVDLKKRAGKLYALCPFHEEDTPSFMVDSQKQIFHCFGCKCGGDIFTFIMKYDNLSFTKSVVKVASYLGKTVECTVQSPTVQILKKVNKLHRSSEFHHKVLPRDLYNKYIDYIDDSWLEEGIKPEMFARYEIKLDRGKNRIVYPVYSNSGDLINIKGRTLYEDFKILKIPKYINYFKVGRMDYLQGLHLSRDAIVKQKEVIVFEGIKSCMKAEGFGFHNVVSAETASLTREQIKTLILLHCDVVIAFDKDKSLKDFCNKDLKMLTKFTNVYYICDDEGLLGSPSEKNSPVDKGEEVWRRLYEKKRRVN